MAGPTQEAGTAGIWSTGVLLVATVFGNAVLSAGGLDASVLLAGGIGVAVTAVIAGVFIVRMRRARTARANEFRAAVEDRTEGERLNEDWDHPARTNSPQRRSTTRWNGQRQARKRPKSRARNST